MKTVIYKSLGRFCTTPLTNFNAPVQNARLIHKLDNFNSATEVIEYYCKWFSAKEEDFIIDASCEME